MDHLSHVLVRLASTMLGDISMQVLLEGAANAATDLLPIDGAGLVLLPTAATPTHLVASDAGALRFEHLQRSLREGPCFQAHDTVAPVSVPDLSRAECFPLFAAAAHEDGLCAVFALPLRHRGASVGVLDLYRMSPGPLTDTEMLAAQALADVVAAYVVNAQNRAAVEAISIRERTAVELLHALEDERDFVAMLVHELGSPLASIAGFTWLLENSEDDLSDRHRHFVAAIHRNSDDLRVLTADLLTLFSSASSAVHAVHTEVDLRTVVAAARAVLTSAPTAPEIGVIFRVPQGPVAVRGDRPQLERMLSNLVSNAVKYTPPGGRVTCTLSRQADHATLEVRDTGIGIPADEQDALFTRFFRASTAKRLGIQGTGLGLAIVKSVVQSHDGTVAVSSSGDGTRFLVRIPLVGAGEPSCREAVG